MSQSCDCCAGIEAVTPEPEANRPGLPALVYRVGTYATFFENMLARLSNFYLDIPAADGGAPNRVLPLQRLTTRDPADPSIALLDAWAIVADVLSFYQERVANEGFLRTATERRSIVELGRLVGYKPRPGVASSVYLAFTVSDGFRGYIPAGARGQSIPGTGETAQFFETSDKLPARDAWNNLKVRLTRPQVITPGGDGTSTAADAVDTLYFKGISTNLKVGDALLLILGGDIDAARPQQVLRFAESVDAQADQKRTEVTLVQPLLKVQGSIGTAVTNAVQPFIDKATALFPGSNIAGSVAKVGSIAEVLQNLIDNVNSIGTNSTNPGIDAANFVRDIIPRVQRSQDIAVKRGFTRLTAWMEHLLQTLQTLVDGLLRLSKSTGGGGALKPLPSNPMTFPLESLGATLKQLTLAPSLQPANAQRLPRTITQTFSPQSDIAPRLLAAFRPSAASTLYETWANVGTQPSGVEAHVMRVKATFFASTYAGAPVVKRNEKGVTTTFPDPPTLSVWGSSVIADKKHGFSTIPLDATYDQMKPRSWVAIDRPHFAIGKDGRWNQDGRATTYHKVAEARTSNMDTGTGFAAKVTLLTLEPPWLIAGDGSKPANDIDAVFSDRPTSTAVLRGTIIYAQSEPLDLAEEPIDTDVEGDSIELADLYDGVEPGRWIIVSGDRTDIPNVIGVAASELAMIAAVDQGAGASEPVHTTLKLASPLAYRYAANTVTLYGNVVNATHGQTVAEALGNGDAAQAFQKFGLRQKPLTYLSAATPAGAQSTLTVRVNEIEWHEADNLAALGPTDRNYITQTDETDNVTAILGDGKHGARPPTGSVNVKAAYRYGIGKPGNVRGGQISQLATRPLGVTGVVNPLPATGGADRDNADQARRNTPIAVKALDRLVSVVDYADFARNFAGVGKASAARLSDGRRQVTHVTIAGADDIPIGINSDLYRNLVQALHQNGDPYLPIQVCLRKVQLLVIAAGVRLMTDYQWESVEPQIRAALLDGFSFDRRELGQSAFLSEAVSLMQGVEGVSYVDVQTFDGVREDIKVTDLASLALTLGLNPYVEARLAQRGDPAAKDLCQRLLPAELVFLTADIPGTLILTEISG